MTPGQQQEVRRSHLGYAKPHQIRALGQLASDIGLGRVAPERASGD
jgi:hypothetical protein